MHSMIRGKGVRALQRFIPAPPSQEHPVPRGRRRCRGWRPIHSRRPRPKAKRIAPTTALTCPARIQPSAAACSSTEAPAPGSPESTAANRMPNSRRRIPEKIAVVQRNSFLFFGSTPKVVDKYLL